MKHTGNLKNVFLQKLQKFFMVTKTIFDRKYYFKLYPSQFLSAPLMKSSPFSISAVHRGAFCHFPFRWIYYYHRSIFTEK